MSDIVASEDECSRYFIFQLGQELYGTPLLGVREVIEAQEIKPLPNTVPHFLGVINLRGQIVGVIDLRLKFGHSTQGTQGNALVVFDTRSGSVAALIDAVDSVAAIPQNLIDTQRNVRIELAPEYLIGIGCNEGRLITLLDLNRFVGAEDITRAGILESTQGG